MSRFMRKPVYAKTKAQITELRGNNLAIFCGCTVRFVRHPEDRELKLKGNIIGSENQRH